MLPWCAALDPLTCCAHTHVCAPHTHTHTQGKPSRSLQAAFKLIDEAGLTADDVVHLERGVYGWYQAELPMVGEYVVQEVFGAAAGPDCSVQGGGVQ